MIPRERHLSRLTASLARSPVVAILGARQVGKTTLASQLEGRLAGPTTRFDLEDPDDLSRLAEPKLALQALTGLVVIDEIQRRPDLFPLLRVLVDRPSCPAKFLVLGSASPDLLRQSSETLAGRIAYHELSGLALDEVGVEASESLWLRGGFPRAFLADTDEASAEWRSDFIRTFLERDLPQLGIRIPAPTLQRFWRMLAHYHGQIWNGAELSRAFGVSSSTVRRYLDVLTGALVLWQLPPWHENVSKRQVKAPKIYLSDSGLLHALLGIRTRHDLDGHPVIGASWEGFVLRELIQHLGVRSEECWFWATHAGAELDLLIVRGQRRFGYEVKRSTAPSVTRSMRVASESLGLNRVCVLHAGDHSFPMAAGFDAVAVSRMLQDVEAL
jgi:predicted AAA+ superfamily ATPase